MMFRRVLLAAAMTAVFVSGASAGTVSYSARLNGRSEVPKTDSKGKGKFDGSFDTQSKVMTYKLTFGGLSGPAAAAHIHGPATRTQTAGVVAPVGDKNPTSPVSGSVTLTDDQVKMLQSAKLYVNVHTAANPGGEIRGQITGLHTRKKPASKAATTAAAAPAATAAPAAAPAAAVAPAATAAPK
jgi:CHRD domain